MAVSLEYLEKGLGEQLCELFRRLACCLPENWLPHGVNVFERFLVGSSNSSLKPGSKPETKETQTELRPGAPPTLASGRGPSTFPSVFVSVPLGLVFDLNSIQHSLKRKREGLPKCL